MMGQRPSYSSCDRTVAMPRRRYPSDLTDAEWAILEPVIPPPKPGGRPPAHSRRELVDAMSYVLRTGCAWRQLPHDLPPWQTVYHYFRRWRDAGIFQEVHALLRTEARLRAGRDPFPTAAILDSQSVRTTEKGGSAAMTGPRK